MKAEETGPKTILRTDDVQVRIMPLGPGAATPEHRHTEVTDTMVCLTGRIRVTRLPRTDRTGDRENVELAPGQRVQIEPGTVHAVANATDEPAEYLLIQGVGKYDFLKA
ncbi:cupin domain-containing protein [Pseudodesulfovibrio sp.]|uniref:cupin domain-containing protein n=1 Tax=unclassified Pseudodesulfovibrio TaxID=2661612 RepID=UPI003B00ECA5